MSLVKDIDDAVAELREAFDLDFTSPKYNCETEAIRLKISNAVTIVQKAYNLVQMSLKLLKDYPDEDTELLKKLEVDLMGDYSLSMPFFKATAREVSGSRYIWSFTQAKPPIGGLKIVSQFLLDSLSYICPSGDLAARLYSAYRSFVIIEGTLQLLKSRLEWTVMYPDSFSKDSVKIRNSLIKHNMDNVWQLFQTGLDNYRQGHLSESANGFSNALTAMMKAISSEFGYSGGQLGQHTMYLEKIGYIHQNVREMISRFYSYLAKFRKGQEATLDEARLLVDLSFTLFGFLAPRLSSYKVDPEIAKKAKKEVRDSVEKQKEEEARRIVTKVDKKQDRNNRTLENE